MALVLGLVCHQLSHAFPWESWCLLAVLSMSSWGIIHKVVFHGSPAGCGAVEEYSSTHAPRSTLCLHSRGNCIPKMMMWWHFSPGGYRALCKGKKVMPLLLEVPKHADIPNAVQVPVHAMCFLVPCYTKLMHLHLLEGHAQIWCHSTVHKMESCQDAGCS